MYVYDRDKDIITSSHHETKSSYFVPITISHINRILVNYFPSSPINDPEIKFILDNFDIVILNDIKRSKGTDDEDSDWYLEDFGRRKRGKKRESKKLKKLFKHANKILAEAIEKASHIDLIKKVIEEPLENQFTQALVDLDEVAYYFINMLNQIYTIELPSPIEVFRLEGIDENKVAFSLGETVFKYSLKSSFNLAIRLAKKYDIKQLALITDVRVRIINVIGDNCNKSLSLRNTTIPVLPLLLTRDDNTLDVIVFVSENNEETLKDLLGMVAVIPLSALELNPSNSNHVAFLTEYFKRLLEPRTVYGYPNKENNKKFCLDKYCYKLSNDEVYLSNVYSLKRVLKSLLNIGAKEKLDRFSLLLLLTLPPEFPWGRFFLELLERRTLRHKGNESN